MCNESRFDKERTLDRWAKQIEFEHSCQREKKTKKMKKTVSIVLKRCGFKVSETIWVF